MQNSVFLVAFLEEMLELLQGLTVLLMCLVKHSFGIIVENVIYRATE